MCVSFQASQPKLWHHDFQVSFLEKRSNLRVGLSVILLNNPGAYKSKLYRASKWLLYLGSQGSCSQSRLSSQWSRWSACSCSHCGRGRWSCSSPFWPKRANYDSTSPSNFLKTHIFQDLQDLILLSCLGEGGDVEDDPFRHLQAYFFFFLFGFPL